MTKVKIRNHRQRKWWWLLILSVIGMAVSAYLGIFLEDHALSPDQLDREGQYCKIETDWMGEAFAVESWDDEDVYEFYMVTVDDFFVIVRHFVDDEEMQAHMDTLYGEDSTYGQTLTLTGASMLVDDELKQLAMEELSYYAGETLPIIDYGDYFYPYYLDLTSEGDMENLYLCFALGMLFFGIALCGLALLFFRHRLRMMKLGRHAYYEDFAREWTDDRIPKVGHKKKLLMTNGYMVVPAAKELVFSLKELAWFYEIDRGRGKCSVCAMLMNGRMMTLCTLRDRSGELIRDYKDMLRRYAPWCVIGYNEQSKKDFNAFNREETLRQIRAKKDDFLSQISLKDSL